jgi:hypothetical protein
VIHGSFSKDEKILKLYEQTQAARDLLGPVEAEYEPLELDLGAEESKLKDKYDRLEKRFDQFFRLQADATSSQSIPSEIQYESSSERLSYTKSAGKQAADYQSDTPYNPITGDQVGIGQLPLEGERKQDGERLQRIGVWMDESRAKLAGTFGRSTLYQMPGTASERIHESSLVDLTVTHGYRGWEPGPDESYDLQQHNLNEDLRGVASNSVFDTVYDLGAPFDDALANTQVLDEGESLLLLDAERETRAALRDYLVNFVNTRDRVNQWLLHQLRLSHREIYALGREVTRLVPEAYDWKMLVVAKWTHDSLGDSQFDHVGSIESMNDCIYFGAEATGDRTLPESILDNELASNLARKLHLRADEDAGNVSGDSIPSNARHDALAESRDVPSCQQGPVANIHPHTELLAEGSKQRGTMASSEFQTPTDIMEAKRVEGLRTPWSSQSQDWAMPSFETLVPHSAAFVEDIPSQLQNRKGDRIKGYMKNASFNKPVSHLRHEQLDSCKLTCFQLLLAS